MSFLPVIYAPDAVDQVPDAYTPDLTLPWAAKASYIWALHPQNPLACDKGGNPLTRVLGTETKGADNWLTLNSSQLNSTTAFRFGDNPDTGKTIGAIAFWWRPTPPTGLNALMGQGLYNNLGCFDATSFSLGQYFFFNGTATYQSGVTFPANVPCHLVYQIKADGSIELWRNGVKQPIGAGGTVTQAALASNTFEIGSLTTGATRYYAQGAMRQVAVVNGDVWTQAEIEDMYARPYAYYIPTDPPESTYVPKQYVPDLALPWAAKATHIWALHPTDPLKSDKGGIPLVRGVGSQTVAEDNWLRFNADSRLDSASAFRIGENPNPAKTIGGMAFWWRKRGASVGTVFHPLVGTPIDYLGMSLQDGAGANFRWITELGNTGDNEWGVTVGQNPLNTPVHVVFQIKADDTLEVWTDGVLAASHSAVQFGFGAQTLFIGGHNLSKARGDIRLVSIINGDTWTPAEIADMAGNPYAYYLPVADPDPFDVPDNYEPNTSLSWVSKASYIWALHPNAPMKCDKGGSAYDLVPYAPPTWEKVENTVDNRILFNQTEWRTAGTFRLGENPDAGKSLFGVAFWCIRRAGRANNDFLGSDNWLNNFSIGDISPLASGTGSFRFGFRGSLYQYLASQIPATAQGDATHVCFQAYLDGTTAVYVNGVKYAGPTVGVGALVNGQFMIGASHSNAGGPQPFCGELRQVMVVNGDTWTDAEIAEMAARPYAYYKKPKEDPAAVPALASDYAMNTQLSWVNKSGYIWALHPSDPLKSSKGSNDLTHISGTETADANNWLSLNGSHWQSSPFRLGDNPDSGKSIFSVAFWWNRRAASFGQGCVGAGNYYLSFSVDDYSDAGAASYDGMYTSFLSQDPHSNTKVTANTPHHIVYQLKADGSVELWKDGIRANLTANSVTQGALATLPFDIGSALYSVGKYPALGAMRQVAIIQGANWTDQEINLMYLRPHAFYGEKVGYKLEAETGYFILSGQPANLKLARRLVADAGIYNLMGQDALLRKAWILAAEHGTYNLTGQGAALKLHRKLFGETGYFVLSGQDAALLKAHVLHADTGYYALLGQDAMLIKPSAGAGRIYHVRGELRTVRIPADTDVWEG